MTTALSDSKNEENREGGERPPLPLGQQMTQTACSLRASQGLYLCVLVRQAKDGWVWEKPHPLTSNWRLLRCPRGHWGSCYKANDGFTSSFLPSQVFKTVCLPTCVPMGASAFVWVREHLCACVVCTYVLKCEQWPEIAATHKPAFNTQVGVSMSPACNFLEHQNAILNDKWLKLYKGATGWTHGVGGWEPQEDGPHGNSRTR